MSVPIPIEGLNDVSSASRLANARLHLGPQIPKAAAKLGLVARERVPVCSAANEAELAHADPPKVRSPVIVISK